MIEVGMRDNDRRDIGGRNADICKLVLNRPDNDAPNARRNDFPLGLARNGILDTRIPQNPLPGPAEQIGVATEADKFVFPFSGRVDGAVVSHRDAAIQDVQMFDHASASRVTCHVSHS